MKRIVVGICGASGALFARKALEILRRTAEVETHLVISEAGRMTVRHELGVEVEVLHSLADRVHDHRDLAAGPASGSFEAHGMIIVPCSVRTLSAIAYSQTADLMTRAADVMLKERRPLVLMVRETPLHAGHLKAMLAATEAGAIIAPPVPALYTRPHSIDDLALQTAARALALVGIACPAMYRWAQE